jgi:hypothetical protein
MPCFSNSEFRWQIPVVGDLRNQVFPRTYRQKGELVDALGHSRRVTHDFVLTRQETVVIFEVVQRCIFLELDGVRFDRYWPIAKRETKLQMKSSNNKNNDIGLCLSLFQMWIRC